MIKFGFVAMLLLLFNCCGKGEQRAVPRYSVVGEGKKFPYLLRCEPGRYPELRGKGRVRNISVDGNFNSFVPEWQLRPFIKKGRAVYAANLMLTNGSYQYRFVVELESGRLVRVHDRRWRFLFDAGWAGKKNRRMSSRSCLYERRSGFVATNGQKLALPGGVRE